MRYNSVQLTPMTLTCLMDLHRLPEPIQWSKDSKDVLEGKLSLPLTVQYHAFRRKSNQSIGHSYFMEYSFFQVSYKEIGRPDLGELVVVESDAFVVPRVLVRQPLVEPVLPQVCSHGIFLKKKNNNKTDALE